MNIELAKRLKEAGFPQVGEGRLSAEIVGFKRVETYHPTLSELIDKCGNVFYSVVRAREKDWRAFSEIDRVNRVATADGKTPEEAVAMLYLALHGETRTPMEGR